MRQLRLVVRGLAVALASGVLALVCLVGWPLAWAFRRAQAWRALLTHLWARALARILGARIEVDGTPPRGAFLLVSNHLSYVDILVLGATLRCAFLSKAEVASWPVVGPLARLSGTLFVERERRRDVVRVCQEIERTLGSGRGVVIFPEGTSTDGATVLPFRSSLLEPAATLGLPVHHATLRYATPEGVPAARETVAWWGDMGFGPHVLGLLGLPGFEARIVFGDEPVRAPDRKTLASGLHQRVASRFLPMLPDERTCLSNRTSPVSS